MMEQLAFDFAPEQGLILLSDVRRSLEKVISPVPSKSAFIRWIESGHIDGNKVSGRWYLRRKSFNDLVLRLRDAKPGTEVF